MALKNFGHILTIRLAEAVNLQRRRQRPTIPGDGGLRPGRNGEGGKIKVQGLCRTRGEGRGSVLVSRHWGGNSIFYWDLWEGWKGAMAAAMTHSRRGRCIVKPGPGEKRQENGKKIPGRVWHSISTRAENK